MTRTELLQLVIHQAKAQGFGFRKWFVSTVDVPWLDATAAVQWLAQGQRCTMLLFSHGFARCFFRSGEQISFVVPLQTFQRVLPGGGSQTVVRKAHVRKSSRHDVWRFHLREMAAAPEPLRYIRRYLLTDELVADQAKSLRPIE